MWEGLLGYTLHTTSEAADNPNDVQLKIEIARSGAFALFAICAYGAMVLLACSALVMCFLTFAEVRPAETGLIGFRRNGLCSAGAARRSAGLAAARRRGGHVGVPVGRARGRAFAWAYRVQMGASRPEPLLAFNAVRR